MRDRHSFLSGLAALPLIGGSVSLDRRASDSPRSENALLAILDAGPISPSDLAFLSQQRRRRAQDGIDALIAALDALEPDPDLEPSFGYLPNGAVADECEPDADTEESLGAPEVEFSEWTGRIDRYGHIDQRRWSDGYRPINGWDADREHDTADDEPVLGHPEQHPSRYACSMGGDGDQTRWGRSGDVDEREDVSEDEGACIQSQVHDAEEPEPSLGSPEIHHDQRRWGQGTKGSHELDHDEQTGLGGFGWEQRQALQRTRDETKAMLRHRGLRPTRPPEVNLLVPHRVLSRGASL